MTILDYLRRWAEKAPGEIRIVHDVDGSVSHVRLLGFADPPGIWFDPETWHASYPRHYVNAELLQHALDCMEARGHEVAVSAYTDADTGARMYTAAAALVVGSDYRCSGHEVASSRLLAVLAINDATL